MADQIFKPGKTSTQVQFGSGASGTIMNIANASERLQSRLAEARQSVSELIAPEITEETKQKALKDVEEGNINSANVAAVARDTYRRTAQASLMADVEIGSVKLGQNLVLNQKENNQYDLNSFTQAWDGYTSSTLQGIRDPLIKKDIAMKLTQQGMKYSSQIAVLQTKQTREIQTDNFNSKLALDTDSLNASFGVNNEAALLSMNEIDNTLQTMVDSNLISQNGALLKKKEVFKGAYLSDLNRQATAAVNAGQAHKFYDAFKKMDHKGILDEVDTNTFAKSLLSRITTDNKIYEGQIKADDDKWKIDNRETTDDFDTKYINKELTQTNIDNALNNNEISLAQHKTYSVKVNDTGPIADNQQKLLLANRHLLDMTEDEILNSPYFTLETRTKLLAKRDSEMADAENWLGTQDGREARRRIRESFNIIDGTMLAALDFANDNMKDYDRMYRDFFGQVQALPLDQRATKSIEIADNLLINYNQGKEQEKTDRREKRVQKKKEEEKQAEKDYNSSMTGQFMNMMKTGWKDTDAAKILEDLE